MVFVENRHSAHLPVGENERVARECIAGYRQEAIGIENHIFLRIAYAPFFGDELGAHFAAVEGEIGVHAVGSLEVGIVESRMGSYLERHVAVVEVCDPPHDRYTFAL